MSELKENGVRVYQFPTDDETVAEMNAAMNVIQKSIYYYHLTGVSIVFYALCCCGKSGGNRSWRRDGEGSRVSMGNSGRLVHE